MASKLYALYNHNRRMTQPDSWGRTLIMAFDEGIFEPFGGTCEYFKETMTLKIYEPFGKFSYITNDGFDIKEYGK